MSTFLRVSYTLSGGLGPYAAAIRAHCAAVVVAHADDLQAAILQSFEESKSGEIYTRADGTAYTASAPGEAPAIRDRALYASIGVAVIGDLARAVFSNDPKADILEYGLGRAAARPFFHPAVEAARAAFIADLADMDAALRRVRA